MEEWETLYGRLRDAYAAQDLDAVEHFFQTVSIPFSSYDQTRWLLTLTIRHGDATHLGLYVDYYCDLYKENKVNRHYFYNRVLYDACHEKQYYIVEWLFERFKQDLSQFKLWAATAVDASRSFPEIVPFLFQHFVDCMQFTQNSLIDLFSRFQSFNPSRVFYDLCSFGVHKLALPFLSQHRSLFTNITSVSFVDPSILEQATMFCDKDDVEGLYWLSLFQAICQISSFRDLDMAGVIDHTDNCVVLIKTFLDQYQLFSSESYISCAFIKHVFLSVLSLPAHRYVCTYFLLTQFPFLYNLVQEKELVQCIVTNFDNPFNMVSFNTTFIADHFTFSDFKHLFCKCPQFVFRYFKEQFLEFVSVQLTVDFCQICYETTDVLPFSSCKHTMCKECFCNFKQSECPVCFARFVMFDKFK